MLVDVLWEDWLGNMNLSSFTPEIFILNGECPHCSKSAAFVSVTKPYEEESGRALSSRWIAALRCVACNGYILGIVRFVPESDYRAAPVYETHYPIGNPPQFTEKVIPQHILDDFNEALRCKWVNAFNATAEMCRRALQSSCLSLGADPNLKLTAQIDWVASQGKIIASLQQMAHKVRLGGNRGAHPPNDPSQEFPLGLEEADAILTFTWKYLEAIFVIPSQLEKYDFSRGAAKKQKS
jgi:hypothetical protein